MSTDTRIRRCHTVRLSEQERQSVLAIQRGCKLPSLDAAIRYAVLELASKLQHGEHEVALEIFQRAVGDGS